MERSSSIVLDARLLAVVEELARAVTLEDVAEVVAHRVPAALGAARCVVGVVTSDGASVWLLVGGASGAVSDDDRRLPATQRLPLVDAACRGAEQWFGSREALSVAYPALSRGIEARGDGAWAFLPLVGDSGRLGGLELTFARPSAFDPELRRAVQTVATHIAVAVERARVVGTLRDSLRITDEVVGILGHDLRNPLHAIALTTENLIAEPGCEPWLRSLVRIRNGAERMARLIDQLLDLAKARLGGGLQVEPVAMDLADLVRAQIEESQPSAEQTIEIEVRGDTTGLWDRDRLAQAITNLLDNAIHHGHPDTPIQVELDGTSGEVLLSVWNGGAIAADLLPVVFEPFRGRRDGGSRRGLGLGLYIAREVVSAHGGVLTVRSSLLSGTTFLLALPRQRPAGS